VASATEVVVIGYMPVVLPNPRRPGDAPVFLYDHEYEDCCARWRRDPSSVLNRFWAGNVSLQRDRCMSVPLPSPHAPIAYHEDEDFGLRLREAGVRGVFDPTLRADHHYRRALPAFLLDAYRQGADRWQLRVAYPDLEDELGWSLVPRSMGLTGHSATRRLIITLATNLARLAGRMHLWRIETDALRLARRLERCRGYEDAARGVELVAWR
jgi:hypothetical protein